MSPFDTEQLARPAARIQAQLLEEIAAERLRQDRKWGADRKLLPEKWHTILSEEVGECAEATLEGDIRQLRQELVQVAAVAVATAEAIEQGWAESGARRATTPVIYLAGPIAGCTDDECKDWRRAVKNLHPACLDPMDRDYRAVEMMDPELAAEIVEGDKREIDRADAVLVWYTHPSVGTSMEILYARSRGKPVVVVDPFTRCSSPWIFHHATAIVATFEDALAIIKKGGAS